jgi:hypothetical protein
MQTPTDNQLHELAHKRVEFRIHLIVYCVINAALWLIWFVTGQGYVWPVWPMAGWGIGVVFHYLFDYRSSSFLSEENEYKKLKKEMEELKRTAE